MKKEQYTDWRADIARWSVPLTGRLPGCPNNLREGLLVRFTDGSQTLFGDCAPLPGFSVETLEDAEQALIDACQRLYENSHLRDLCRREGVTAALGNYPSSVVFAIECALGLVSDIDTTENSQSRPGKIQLEKVQLEKIQSGKFPICRLLSGVNNTILSQSESLTSDVSVVKIKVGRQPLADDIALVCQMDKLLPASTMIRLDGNRCWSYEQACTFARQIPKKRIAFIEEPLKNPDELAAFALSERMPVALDESLQWRHGGSCALFKRKLEKRLDKGVEGLAAFVVKPTLAGGIWRCRELARLAQKHELALVISASYESNIGIDALASLSMNFAPDVAPGLDTLSVFNHSLLNHSFFEHSLFKKALESPLLCNSPDRPVIPWSSLKPVWSSHV